MSTIDTNRSASNFESAELSWPGLNTSFLPLTVGFVLLLVIIAATGWLAYRQTSDQEWVRHTADVQHRIARVLTFLLDAETGQRGYLVTGDDSYLEPFNRAAPSVENEIDNLRAATADNETQQRRVAALRVGDERALKLRAIKGVHLAADRTHRVVIQLCGFGQSVREF
jgi:CHASE3 domain sensor protein